MTSSSSGGRSSRGLGPTISASTNQASDYNGFGKLRGAPPSGSTRSSNRASDYASDGRLTGISQRAKAKARPDPEPWWKRAANTVSSGLSHAKDWTVDTAKDGGNWVGDAGSATVHWIKDHSKWIALGLTITAAAVCTVVSVGTCGALVVAAFAARSYNTINRNGWNAQTQKSIISDGVISAVTSELVKL